MPPGVAVGVVVGVGPVGVGEGVGVRVGDGVGVLLAADVAVGGCVLVGMSVALCVGAGVTDPGWGVGRTVLMPVRLGTLVGAPPVGVNVAVALTGTFPDSGAVCVAVTVAVKVALLVIGTVGVKGSVPLTTVDWLSAAGVASPQGARFALTAGPLRIVIVISCPRVQPLSHKEQNNPNRPIWSFNMSAPLAAFCFRSWRYLTTQLGNLSSANVGRRLTFDDPTYPSFPEPA